MSIRLAVAKPLRQLRRDHTRLRRMRLACANDNTLATAETSANSVEGNVLHAALRHFARHGLSAAQNAANEANAARSRGDEAEYLWWHDICHTLDRGLARKLGS